MFDYFIIYLSNAANAHQVCCEDSPTKDLYDHFQSDDLDLQGHNCISNSTTF